MKLFLSLFHLLWPRTCSGCEKPLIHSLHHCFCLDCISTLLPLQTKQGCNRCAAPFPEKEYLSKNSFLQTEQFEHNKYGTRNINNYINDYQNKNIDNYVLKDINNDLKSQDNDTYQYVTTEEIMCIDCQRLSPAFSQVFAVYEYGGVITKALHQLKWQKRDDLAKPLGKLLAPLLSQIAADYDLIIPVPLHFSRLLERGYNQTLLLAKAARSFAQVSLPIKNQVLQRKQKSAPLQHKTPEERILQTKEAFVVSKRQSKYIKNQRILLIDDVVTTGATAQACTLALLDAGASCVSVLALCRAAL